MRLYPRDETTGAVASDGVTYQPAEDGGFDFPPELATHLRTTHVGGRKVWEDSIERQNRMIADEMARRADPRTLLDAVEQLVKAAGATAVPDAPKAPAKAAPAPAVKAAAPAAAGK